MEETLAFIVFALSGILFLKGARSKEEKLEVVLMTSTLTFGTLCGLIGREMGNWLICVVSFGLIILQWLVLFRRRDGDDGD